MSIRGTRGAPPPTPNGMSGSQAQLQSVDMGMHRHSPGPVPMPGTGPTDSGGGRSRAEGGQDPNSTSYLPPDGSSDMDSSDGPMNSGIRARNNTSSQASHEMIAGANNNNVAAEAIDLIKFLGGSNQCPTNR